MPLIGRYETIVLLLAGALFSAIVLVYQRRSPVAWFLVAVSWIAFYLIFDRIAQFLVCDETYTFWEIIDFKHAWLLMWRGGFRTTDIIVGTAMTILRACTHVTLDYCLMAAKMFHALVGIGIMVTIGFCLGRIYSPKAARPTFYCFYAIFTAFLPITLLSLKLMNYDLFSMLFGALAIVLLGIAIKQKQRRWFLLSIAAAFLGAQEKLITSPLLWICIAALGFFSAMKEPTGNPVKFSRMFSKGFGAGFLFALAMDVLSYFILLANRHGSLPKEASGPVVFFDPFTAGSWVILRAAGGDSLLNRYTVFSQTHPWSWLVMMTFVLIIATLILSLAAFWIIRLWTKNRQRMNTQRFLAAIPIVNHGMFFVFFIIGAVAIYHLSAHIAPFVPIPVGAYHPTASFNSVMYHFGAKTMAGHYLFSIAWGYAHFFLTLPTPFIIAALFCLVFDIRAAFGKSEKPTVPMFFETVLFVCLLVPILYSLTQTPVVIRYFNLFLFLIAAITALRFTFRIMTLRPAIRAGLILLIAGSFTAELWPFRPFFGAFRPVWVNYPHEYNTSPAPSYIKPSWEGNGEELMLAGKWIEKHEANAGTPSRPITLNFYYYGEWRSKSRNTQTQCIVLDPPLPVHYTENDFFIINRAGLHMNLGRFPAQVTPLHIISFRGFDQAWVYRGDQLARAGFVF